jgi:tRNA(Ile)-lysidine synthase
MQNLSTQLTREIRRWMRRHDMVRAGDRVGVAVSGGADSVALLLLLHELAPSLGLQLAVVHVDHALRPESAADAEFVAALAARLHLDFFLERAPLDVHPTGAHEIACDNVEQWARQFRYTFFGRLIAGQRMGSIATAHTADDQAETVLERLLRGSGTAGLAGIRPILASIPAGASDDQRAAPGPELGNSSGHAPSHSQSFPQCHRPRIIRPVLSCRRADLRAWLTGQGQSWREDASNLALDRLRNRIRHRLLPLLERDANPNLTAVLAATAERANDEEAYWAGFVEPLAAELWRPAAWTSAPSAGESPSGNADAVEGDCRALRRLPRAVRRRVLRAGIGRVQDGLRRVAGIHIEQVMEAIGEADAAIESPPSRPPAPGKLQVEFAGVTVQVTARMVRISRRAASDKDRAASSAANQGRAPSGQ